MAAAAAPAKGPFNGGELVVAGGTDWAMLGRSGGKQKKDPQEELERETLYPNLYEPHRLKNMMGVKIAFVAAGPAAVHCMAGDMEGRLYTWGRNEKGQLGHGDHVQRNMPKVVEALKNKFVVGGAGGRFHSVVVTKEGESYSFGSNNTGQLGLGSIKKHGKVVEDLHPAPHKALVVGCSQVSCGVDFTMWLCNGKVFAAGNPQYGQCGDGSDHSYNAKDSSIAIMYDPVATPKLVEALQAKTITRVVCGHNHSIATDSEGAAYSWGNGGYGRLGHKVQKDEFAPKRIEEFKNRLTVQTPEPVVAAGNTSSFCTIVGGQLYSWGKLKTSGDNQMYPQCVMDLAGWNIRSMSCGPATYCIAADNSVITWGQATNGELGYGANGKKSSANPDKCLKLEEGVTQQVASGVGFNLFLLDPAHPKLANMPVFESTAPEVEAVADEPEPAAKGKGGRGGKAAAGTKRKAEPAAKGGKKAK